MSRDKKVLFKIIGVMMIISLFTSQITYASTNIKSTTNKATGLKTIEVAYGDYIEKGTLKNLELSYPRRDILFIEEPEGTFIEYLVENGQNVKKGDPLVAYIIPSDSIGVEENNIKLSQSVRTYEMQSEQKRIDIEDKYEQWNAMDAGSIEAQMLEINIRKMELEYEQYEYDTQKSLEDMKTKTIELEEALKIQYILAPYDGVVRTVNWMSEGFPLDRSRELIEIYDANSAILASKATNLNKLWYDMEVRITPTSDRSQVKGETVSGRVVGADSLFNGKVSAEMVYIQLEDASKITTVQRADIETELVRVNNVILIPISAVTTANDISYVYIVDDNGDMYKQYVTGRSNGVEMWVFNGLSAGQKIVAE